MTDILKPFGLGMSVTSVAGLGLALFDNSVIPTFRTKIIQCFLSLACMTMEKCVKKNAQCQFDLFQVGGEGYRKCKNFRWGLIFVGKQHSQKLKPQKFVLTNN